MTDNEKLARWQGWTHDEINLLKHRMSWIAPDGITRHDIYPSYPNDDAAAMSLLDTLVEKTQGDYCLISRFDGYKFVWSCADWATVVIHKPTSIPDWKYYDTRREAVVAAVLKLIQEDKNEHEKGYTNNSFNAEPQSTIKIFGAICNINYFQ